MTEPGTAFMICACMKIMPFLPAVSAEVDHDVRTLMKCHNRHDRETSKKPPASAEGGAFASRYHLILSLSRDSNLCGYVIRLRIIIPLALYRALPSQPTGSTADLS